MIASPNGWEVAQLGQLVSIEIGRTPSRANARYWNGSQLWLTISDFVHGQRISSTRERVTEEAVRACGIRIHEPGTLVMSFKLTIGKLGFLDAPIATNEAIVALKPLTPIRIDLLFLYHVLSAFNFDEHVDRAAKGRTLNKAKLTSLPISFPKSIQTQRRIAAILSEADEIRRMCDKSRALADQFLRGSFLERFGDPISNPKGLPVVPIKELARVVTGNTPPRKDPSNYGPGIEWIKSDNINLPFHFLTKAEETLTWKGHSIARTVPAGSTLVTCIAGSPNSIGNASLADREVAFNQQINAAIPNSDVDPFFLYSHFLIGKPLIQNASTNSMKGMVSKGKFQEIQFLRPPSSEQKKFGQLFQKVMHVADALQNRLLESEALFGALEQRAFRGEL